MANPTPFVALNYQTASPQMVRYLNSTPSPVGVTFGVRDAQSNITPSNLLNKASVIQFLGSQTFIAVTGGVIYRSTNAGASWGSTAGTGGTLALAATGQSIHTGFHVLFDSSGLPWLVCIFKASTAKTYGAIYSNDGINWTTFTDTASTNSTPLLNEAVIYQGRLATVALDPTGVAHFSIFFSINTKVFSFVPITLTPQVILVGGLSHSLCVYQDTLILLVYGDLGGDIWEWDLYQFAGTTWALLFTQVDGTTVSGEPGSDNKACLFTDNTYLYTLTMNNVSPAAWKLNRFDSSYTRTDISSVLPAPFLSGGASNAARAGILVDGEGAPGAIPNIFVFFATNGATTSTWVLYQFNNSTLWTLIDTGGSAGHSMPFIKESQGDYTWTSGDYGVEIVSIGTAVGGLRIGFILYSNSGSASVGIKAFHGLQMSAYPTIGATLSNPSVGSLSGAGAGNSVTGLTADNTTVYLVTWNTVTDGYAPGQRPKFVLEQI